MQVANLPAMGTIVLIQGGLALLGIAFAAKWAVKRIMERRSTDKA